MTRCSLVFRICKQVPCLLQPTVEDKRVLLCHQLFPTLKCRIVPSLAGLRRGSDSRASRQRIVGKWKRAPSSAIEMGMGSTSLASSLLPSFCYACNVSISRTAALRRSCATTGVNDRRQLGIQHASRGSSTRSSCGESVRASSQLEIARKVTTTDRQRCCPTRGGVG